MLIIPAQIKRHMAGNAFSLLSFLLIMTCGTGLFQQQYKRKKNQLLAIIILADTLVIILNVFSLKKKKEDV